MKEQTQCTQCGQPLTADAPQGLCPACLLNLAAHGQTDALDPSVMREADPSLDVPTEAPAPAGKEQLEKLFPQLEILEQLGAGGMGVVYKARQKQLDRLVALKLMHPRFSRDPQFAERFNREARALAKLSHPSIVNVYDFGQAGEQFYFIMEYVDGANLQQLIATKSFSATEALALVPKLCDALQYAHDEGVVHRDIKPANILVDKKGRVKVADFGLAKIAGVEEAHLTGTNQGMGTMMYMAPEQMENAKSVDHRADIYSLGVVLYEMLTGELPVGRFVLPSRKVKVDVRFDEIVLHALEHDRERRYQRVNEVKTAVEEVTSSPNRKIVEIKRMGSLAKQTTVAVLACIACVSLTLWITSGKLNPDQTVKQIADAAKAALGSAAAPQKIGAFEEALEKMPNVSATWKAELAECQLQVGLMYLTERGVPKNEVEAVNWFRKGAELGNSAAQDHMGRCYLNGIGVAPDFSKALIWLNKAIDQNNPHSYGHLGYIYLYGGKDFPPDLHKGVAYTLKSAEMGSVVGYVNAGIVYENGTGIQQNFVEAAKWYRKGADLGDGVAQNRLGHLFMTGSGVVQNYQEAARWFNEAIMKNNPEAMAHLAWMCLYEKGIPKDIDKGKALAMKSAEMGCGVGYYVTGTIYETGTGVERNYSKAVEWYRKGSDAGDSASQIQLALLYYGGNLGTRNEVEAIALARTAAKQGNKTAVETLKKWGFSVENN